MTICESINLFIEKAYLTRIVDDIQDWVAHWFGHSGG